MSGWREVKRLETAGHRAVIELGGHGFYRLTSLRWVAPGEAIYVLEGDWTPDYESGLYESVEMAEREARQVLPWLRMA
jgi:hypothetical protein